MWGFKLDKKSIEDVAKAKDSRFTVSCAREPFDVGDPYAFIRFCKDEKEVQEAVVVCIACGYEIIDVRPYASEVKLMRCPFCYGEAQVGSVLNSDRYFIHCNDCGAETSKQFKSEEEAIKAWNMRTADSMGLCTAEDFWD